MKRYNIEYLLIVREKSISSEKYTSEIFVRNEYYIGENEVEVLLQCIENEFRDMTRYMSFEISCAKVTFLNNTLS